MNVVSTSVSRMRLPAAQRLVSLEAGAGEQVAGVVASRLPLVERRHESGVGVEVVAALVDPVAQTVPLGEQGLVGHLDGGGAGGGVAVEGERAGSG